MKSFDTGYTHNPLGNPARIGPYRVHAAIFPAEDGRYGAIMFAERVDGNGPPRPALNMHKMPGTYETDAIAGMQAISFGISCLKETKALC